MKIALLGHMGRDEAVADRLMDHQLHILGQWENPGLVEKAEQSGGSFSVIRSITEVDFIADRLEQIHPHMFITNFDDALAAGIVDEVKQRISEKKLPEMAIPCPDQDASRIEWDKFYLRELIDKIDPKYNPINFMATSNVEVNEAIDFFDDLGIEVVVKPRNLTGGKGVKVMGKHLTSHADARDYANKVLSQDNQDGVEIQEKLEGYEFTLQIFTDGKTMIAPPTTFDFPYREDGDTGPGTGGMGSFTMENGKVMPFMTRADYSEAMSLMAKILDELKDRGIEYKGVLYPTFFKTSHGLKIVEINARGGDPELINVVDSMEDDVDLAEVYWEIANGELNTDSIRYKNVGSAVVYLVSPDYGYRQGKSYKFGINRRVIEEELGCKLRFAAAIKEADDIYRTVGSSRSVALSNLGQTPQDARKCIINAIAEGFSSPFLLDFRWDVASKNYIDKMRHHR